MVSKTSLVFYNGFKMSIYMKMFWILGYCLIGYIHVFFIMLYKIKKVVGLFSLEAEIMCMDIVEIDTFFYK